MTRFQSAGTVVVSIVLLGASRIAAQEPVLYTDNRGHHDQTGRPRLLSLLLASSFTGDETNERIVSGRTADEIMNQQARTSKGEHLTADDTISDLLNHPAFAGFGRLLLPWDDRAFDSSLRLRNIGSLLPYHTHVNAAPVVGALNHMIDDVNSGKTIFYEFYTADEKKEQPAKSNSGLFWSTSSFGTFFAFRFLNIQRINPCKRCRENVISRHRPFSSVGATR